MYINYKKLWILCVEHELSKGDLRKLSGISSATLTKLRRNEEVSVSVLMKIATVLKCNIGDMLDFVKEDEKSPCA